MVSAPQDLTKQEEDVMAEVKPPVERNRDDGSVIDNSGPVPVTVPPLQQERERIAKRGLAHASFKVGQPVSETDVNGATVIGTHPPAKPSAVRPASVPSKPSTTPPKAKPASTSSSSKRPSTKK